MSNFNELTEVTAKMEIIKERIANIPKHIIFLVGAPGSGKSLLIDQVLKNLIQNYSKKNSDIPGETNAVSADDIEFPDLSNLKSKPNLCEILGKDSSNKKICIEPNVDNLIIDTQTYKDLLLEKNKELYGLVGVKKEIAKSIWIDACNTVSKSVLQIIEDHS